MVISVLKLFGISILNRKFRGKSERKKLMASHACKLIPYRQKFGATVPHSTSTKPHLWMLL